MKIGTTLFRLAAAAGWVVLLIVSTKAVQAAGFNGAGAEFMKGFGAPWPAQFNTDFTLHLLLVAVWMTWRAKAWWVGLICGILAINLGALFTLAFLVVLSFKHQGDFRKVLLGARTTA